MFPPASPEERKTYYNEEWSPEDVPDFIASSIENREFGFDHDGRGPSDRYNQIYNLQQLEWYLQNKYPYAAYSSISFYEKPRSREGWLKAELVFDIDAKDLPMRRCSCAAGDVCETCLGDAKEFLYLITDTLKGDLGIKEMRYVYSGRGYHMRVFDEGLMEVGSTERAYILDYITGGVIPTPERMKLKGGYPRVFKERFLKFLELATEERLREIPGIGQKKAAGVIAAKWKIANEVEDGSLETLEGILKKESLSQFMEHLRSINAGMLDGKVTVDVKRILRLPSSLHSAASMKCVEIKDLEKFDPLRDAVPKFVGERK